jgi:hypothetical protein
VDSHDYPSQPIGQLVTGVDRFASELAIQRLEREIARLSGDVLIARLATGQRWIEGTVGTVVGVAISLALIGVGALLLQDRQLLSTSVLFMVPGLVLLAYIILTRGRTRQRIHKARAQLESLEAELSGRQADLARMLNRVQP